jgi:hypothetical protein
LNPNPLTPCTDETMFSSDAATNRGG